MDNLFLALMFLTFILFFVSLIKPQINFWTKNNRRKHSFVYLAAAVAFFILFGVTTPPTTQHAETEQIAAVSIHNPDQQKERHKTTNDDNSVSADNDKKTDDKSEVSKDDETSATNDDSESTTSVKTVDDEKSSTQSESSSTPISAPSNLVAATVSNNVDGDTIHVNLNGKDETIRMLLIDTPEDKDPRKPVEPFGYKAADYAASVLSPGKHIYLQVGKKGYERDKYDRLLAYVYLSKTDMYNYDVIKKGLARVAYIYPPNTDHLSDLQAAQNYAKSHKLGIWSLAGFVDSDGYDLVISCNYAAKNGYSTRGCGTTTTTTKPETSDPPSSGSTSTNVSGSTLDVEQGQIASVTITTKPGTSGTIEVIYKSGPSKAEGLEPKTADGNGKITWSWKVGSRTTPGDYDVNITANGKTIHKTLTVREN